jgi:hypothetical protein
MATQDNTQPETAGGAIPSMVCGIVGIVTCCLPVVPIVLGIIAIVLSVKVNRRIKESQGALGGKGMAVAGLVCGIIAIVFGLFYLLYYIILGGVLGMAALGSLGSIK